MELNWYFEDKYHQKIGFTIGSRVLTVVEFLSMIQYPDFRQFFMTVFPPKFCIQSLSPSMFHAPITLELCPTKASSLYPKTQTPPVLVRQTEHVTIHSFDHQFYSFSSPSNIHCLSTAFAFLFEKLQSIHHAKQPILYWNVFVLNPNQIWMQQKVMKM